MKNRNKLFLEALKASLKNEKVTWDFSISPETWKQLFELAESQKVLPLIFDAVSSCPSAKCADSQFMQNVKQRGIAIMMCQVRKTAEFLQIYQAFAAEDIYPLVVKGILCRELYPNPDLRISADEDILVPAESFKKCMEILQRCGLQPTNLPADVDKADEVGFIAPKGSSYIELHKSLFSESSEAYREFNHYFATCFDEKMAVEIHGSTIYTLKPDMHLFYLICHAFKHFLHSGFGLRQVCDITLFANVYGSEIDWQQLLENCKEIHADKFVAAIFKIGTKYLTFDEKKAAYPEEWRGIEIDEEPLLYDLLGSGIYGGATMSRRHSSNMTLKAVAAEKQGKCTGTTLVSMIFPSVKELEARYPYLIDRPYLLPAAWIQRLFTYQKEISKLKDSSVVDAVKIGNQRIELLKKYGILEK